MISTKVETGVMYVTVTNENPALALAEANGYVAKMRKNWVIKEVVADKENEESVQFIGLKLVSS